MSRELKQFVIKTSVASLILIALGWIVFNFFVPGKYLFILPWMLAFFFLVTLATYTIQLRMARKDIRRFTNTSMIVSFLRLVLYSAFAFIYLAGDSENAAVFIVCLVVFYLVFTFLEVSDLTRISKRLKK